MSTSTDAKLIVADDEHPILRLLRILLTRTGYAVTTCDSGNQALDEFRREPADLLLTDIRMPGMDGIDLAGAVRRVDPEVPVLFISGSLDDAKITGRLRTELNANPRSGFIAKPFDIEELVAKVKRMLEFRRTRRNG